MLLPSNRWKQELRHLDWWAIPQKHKAISDKSQENLSEYFRKDKAWIDKIGRLRIPSLGDGKDAEELCWRLPRSHYANESRRNLTLNVFLWRNHLRLLRESPKIVSRREKWKGWTPKDLIKSSGTADYSNKELSYTVSTEFGFSGAPIVITDKGKCHIVGLHTRGSHFHSKNYGILFNQTFFMYLQKDLNEFLLRKEDFNSL